MTDSPLHTFPSSVVLVTGISASGKSTVAQALAERLPRSVHLRGDVFRRMVVNGRADMTPALVDEAERQLLLRYELAASVADRYARARFTVVLQDVVLGKALAEVAARLTTLSTTRPLFVVVLAPDPVVVARRDAARARATGKTGYTDWTVEQLDGALRRETPRLGLWLDTSDQNPEETVDEILARTAEARVDGRSLPS